MITFPNAKINIGLYITARRPDGYHDIVTAMIPTDWCDILEIVPAKGDEPTLRVSGRVVDCPVEKNLVMRAFIAMKERYNIPAVDIYLNKIIPDGAGLGGGSADAAFTIKMLNNMFGLNQTDETLADIAATLGSDCPFFIHNRPMIATGTGTTLSPFEFKLSGCTLVIVKPGVHVSTADAYGGCSPRPSSIKLDEVLASTSVASWQQAGVVNDFEKTVFKHHPLIAEVKEKLYALGASYASMSGSGASVFAIFERDILAENIAEIFQGMDIHISKV